MIAFTITYLKFFQIRIPVFESEFRIRITVFLFHHLAMNLYKQNNIILLYTVMLYL